MTTSTHNSGRIARIMESYNDLPTWVKVWMNFILGPVNLATLAFLDQPNGALIAALAIGGMAITVSIVFIVGEFSKLASAGHVLPWTPLVLMLIFSMPDGTAVYQAFLTLLLVTNAISLVFDLNDLRVLVVSKRTN